MICYVISIIYLNMQQIHSGEIRTSKALLDDDGYFNDLQTKTFINDSKWFRVEYDRPILSIEFNSFWKMAMKHLTNYSGNFLNSPGKWKNVLFVKGCWFSHLICPWPVQEIFCNYWCEHCCNLWRVYPKLPTCGHLHMHFSGTYILFLSPIGLRNDDMVKRGTRMFSAYLLF